MFLTEFTPSYHFFKFTISDFLPPGAVNLSYATGQIDTPHFLRVISKVDKFLIWTSPPPATCCAYGAHVDVVTSHSDWGLENPFLSEIIFVYFQISFLFNSNYTWRFDGPSFHPKFSITCSERFGFSQKCTTSYLNQNSTNMSNKYSAFWLVNQSRYMLGGAQRVSGI